MKKLALLSFLIVSFSFGNNKVTSSKIKSVTVYLQNAQITREAPIQLSAGVNEIILGDLSPYIDANSIQISGLKSVSVLGINYKIDYLKTKNDTEAISALLKQRKAFLKELSLLQNKIKGLEEEETLLTTNRKLGTEQEGTNLAKVKEFASHYGNRIASIRDEIYDAKEKIKELNDQTTQLNLQIKELKNNNGPEKGEIKLKLDSRLAVNVTLEVSYVVSNAGWFPVYDIKAKNVDSPLSFYYKAHVFQRTGTDWNNAKITLSTGDPSIDTNKPDITPYYLNFVNPYTYKSKEATRKSKFKYNPLIKKVTGIVLDESGLPLPGANVIVKGTSIGTQTDFDGRYTIDIKEGQKLVFSYLGQKNEEVPIYASQININLNADTDALEEVVVTGYGTRLKAKAPRGVVRGLSSIEKKKAPLYIVDGVPQDDISNIDQSEIKNMEVVKGASAVAIYGDRASGGVVIVATKTASEVDNLISKEFKIKKVYTIPSANDVTAITIDEFSINAEYEYFSAPLLNENVFLTTKLTSWEQFDLLPGEANIYFAGSYAGKTFVDPFQTEKALTISLGIEPNIVIERKQINDLKSTAFIGNNKIINKAYEISIKNNGAKKIPLVVMDRIPISQNKEIKIDDITYGDAAYDDKKRILSWKIDVSSQSTIIKQISYKIKYPKGKNINL